MISSMSVLICNRFHATSASSGKIATLGGGVVVFNANSCAGLLEPKGSKLGQLKSTFNAENYVRRLSWSISSHFVAIHCRNVRCSQKLRKIQQNPSFGGSRSFKVIGVDKSQEPVTSACYDMQ